MRTRLVTSAAAVLTGVLAFAPALPADATVVSFDSIGAVRLTVPVQGEVRTVTGSGLAAGDTLAAYRAGTATLDTTVHFTPLEVAGDGMFTTEVSAPAGDWYYRDLVVTDPSDGSTATCAQCLYLGAPPAARADEWLLVDQTTDAGSGTGSITLYWRAFATGSSPTTSYALKWSDASGDSGSADVSASDNPTGSLTGLPVGVPLTVGIVGTNAYGDSAPYMFDETLGVQPTTPRVNVTPEVNALGVHVDTQAWETGGSIDVEVTQAGRNVGGVVTGGNGTYPFGGPYDFTVRNLDAPGPDMVTVSVTNGIGTPATTVVQNVHAITVPSRPRDIAWRYAAGIASITWQTPSDNGGTPVTGYIVTTGYANGTTTRHRTTATHLSVPLATGQEMSYSVAARNAVGVGAAAPYNGRVIATRDIVTTLNAWHRALWRYADSGVWHKVGGRWSAPPSATSDHRLRPLLVAGKRDGSVWIWRLGAWHRVPIDERCFVPTGVWIANVSGYRGGALQVSCRRADGRLGVVEVPAASVSGVSYALMDSRVRPVGVPVSDYAGGLDVVTRVAPFDTAGDDVVENDVAARHVYRIHLACRTPVAASGEGYHRPYVACKTGPRSITYVSTSRGRILRRHVVRTPTAIRGAIGMTDWLFDDLQTLSYIDAAGVLRVWDSHVRTWTVRGRHVTGGTHLGIDN